MTKINANIAQNYNYAPVRYNGNGIDQNQDPFLESGKLISQK